LALVAWLSGDVVTAKLDVAFVMPEFIRRSSTGPRLSVSAYPFSRHDGVTKCAGLRHDAGLGLPGGGVAADHRYRRLALLLSPFGVFSICIAAITAAICQSPDAHPDAAKRWKAAVAAGYFICWRAYLAARSPHCWQPYR
jgi:benzoate membrane transport protein